MSKETYSNKLLDPRWQKKRLEIMGRDCFTCQKCGATGNTLHVHHRHYLIGRDPWDYSGELLITLCQKCHKEEEDTADIGPNLVNTMHFWGFFNTEIRDELNKLINQKIQSNGKRELLLPVVLPEITDKHNGMD